MIKNAKLFFMATCAFIFFVTLGFVLGANYKDSNGLVSKILSYPAEKLKEKQAKADLDKFTEIQKKVLPEEGFTLPISWNDMGLKLVSLGVIDAKKFEEAVKPNDEQKEIVEKGTDKPIKIDLNNGQFVVDMLWALGLAQKSVVYTEGPLGKEYKSQQGSFASTGGWTLAKGDAVNYLGKFDLIPLTSEQQSKVADIAKNVYRPCCGNPTWFPDCNHGMAALSAIELMVSKGLPDDEIYKNVLKLNTMWFPQNYLTAAMFFAKEGTEWDKVDAKRVLGAEFSSSQGAAEIAKKVGPLPGQQVGGSCGA